MKKNDAILLSAVTTYSMLFYRQSAGINFIIFDIVMITLLLMLNKSLLKNRLWLTVAAGTLISGFGTMLYGNGLCVISSAVSLLLLSAVSFSKNSSVIFGLLYSVYSTLSAVVYMFIDFVSRRNKAEKSESKKGKTVLSVLIAAVILIFFFILYRESNPLFKDFTRNINLDFISFEWIRFTLGGLILLYGFFYHRNIPSVYNYDLEGSDNAYTLEQDKIKSNKISEWFGLPKELTLGISLFILLNLMILIVNGLDIVYLWCGNALPVNMDYSAAVHQSVGNLITSILAAIVLILFFFRAELNFIKNNRLLRVVAYFWIFQNAILLASTMYRNHLYIAEFALTQKRIGVYFYLLLCMAGLLSAGIKIFNKKRNWYLFRFNGMVVYVLLIVSTLINWDALITRYNLKHTKNADYQYLVNLNYSNLPDLEQFFNSEEFSNQPKNTILGNSDKQQLKNQTDKKLYEFFQATVNNDFRSWCYDDSRIKSELISLTNNGIIKNMDFSGGSIKSLLPIICLSNLTEMNISRNNFTAVNDLKYFPMLRSVNLSGNSINNIDSLPELTNLTELDLSVNYIKNLKALMRFKKLKTLDISNNGVVDLEKINSLKTLEKLDISGNTVINSSILSELKTLKVLKASRMPNASINNIPVLPEIEELYISNNGISDTSYLLTEKLSKLRKLNFIDLSGNAIEIFNPYAFSKSENTINSETSPAFMELKTLDISSNKIRYTGDLREFKNLAELRIGYNQLVETGTISTAATLERLYIQGNRISDFSQLMKLKNLKFLDISANPVMLSKTTQLPAYLEYLNVSGCNIAEIEFLKQFTRLKTLNVSSTGIKDITLIAQMKTLTTLDISENSTIIDLSPLYTMKQLTNLIIPKVSDEKFQKLKEALPATTIYMTGTIENSSTTSYDR
jgi:Leucine-rich repeat (LRR) protein